MKTTAGDIKPYDAAVMNLAQTRTWPEMQELGGTSVRDAEDIDRFTGALTLDDAHERDPYTQHAQPYTIHASGPGFPFAVGQLHTITGDMCVQDPQHPTICQTDFREHQTKAKPPVYLVTPSDKPLDLAITYPSEYRTDQNACGFQKACGFWTSFPIGAAYDQLVARTDWRPKSILPGHPDRTHATLDISKPGGYEVSVLITGKDGELVVDMLSVSVIDLDIDSDNANGFDPPVHNDAEEKIEDDPTKPGKFIAVNDGDADHDGMPDVADLDTSMVYAGNEPVRFTPLVLTLPESLDAQKVNVRFTYADSDPSQIAGTGTEEVPYRAAPGHLRLWKVDGNVARSAAEVNTPGGHFIKPGVAYKASDLGSGPFYVEGIAANATLGDQQIKVEIDPNGDEGEPGFIGEDAVRVTVIRADVDIDSDNNNGFDKPPTWPRTDYEDQIENIQNDSNKPGKLIPVNNGDADSDKIPQKYGDGIPDFADFDITVAPGDTPVKFTPLILELPEPLDVAKVKVRFTYSASDPTNVGSGTAADPYSPAPGSLRIWKVDGSEKRKVAEVSAGGHFVKSQAEYKASDLGPGRIIPLYVEGIRGSASIADQEIKVEIDPNGDDGEPKFMGKDIVRASVIDLALPVVNTDYPMTMDPPAMPTNIIMRSSNPGLGGAIEYHYLIGDPFTGHILEYEDKPNGYIDPPGTLDSGWVANREWTIQFGNDDFYGGRFTSVRVQIRRDVSLIGDFMFKRHFFIVGDALTTAMMTNYLATLNLDPQDVIMAKAIARSETDTTHFSPQASGGTSHRRYPLRSIDGGYGVFQLTNPVPNRLQIWNWQRNTDEGLRLIRQKKAIAIGKLSAHRPYTEEQVRHETYAAYNGGSYYVWNGNQWVEDPAYTCGCNGPRWGQGSNPPFGRCRALGQCYANVTFGLEY